MCINEMIVCIIILLFIQEKKIKKNFKLNGVDFVGSLYGCFLFHVHVKSF